MAVPPRMGVPTASSGEVKTACGRANDHGMMKLSRRSLDSQIDAFVGEIAMALCRDRLNAVPTPARSRSGAVWRRYVIDYGLAPL